MDDQLSSLGVFRAEVRTWLSANWSAEGVPLRPWLEQAFEEGFTCPSWPLEWGGRGLPKEASYIAREEFLRVGAPGAGQDLSNIAANTILTWGSDELKRTWLRPLATATVRTCLLYSEPGAGSDLASLQTRAELREEEWVVNGQKVWTTGAKEADFGLLAARTNWDVPKHQGISYFLCPMHQPGVEVRPIIQITGGSSFNEVFLDDARVPKGNLIGEAGNGWRVLQTALSVERVQLSGLNSGAEAQPRPDPGRLAELARRLGRSTEPEIRQAVAELYCWQMVNRWNGLRSQAAGAQGVASVNKICQSRIAKRSAELELELIGSDCLINEPGTPAAGATTRYLASFSSSLIGGTDQIQRNIVGERILGLPREPEVDRDVPFSEVRKSAPARR